MKPGRGFTLLEMAVVVSVIGITTLIMAPALNSFIGMRKASNTDLQALINQKIGRALIDLYAESQTRLSPYTGSDSEGLQRVSAPASGTLIANYLRAKTDLPDRSINDDGSVGRKARVLQVVSLSQTLPIYYRSGPLVQLDYQYAVIYSTTSSVRDNNPENRALPGNSDSMTAANYATWSVSGNDFAPYFFSTLPIQKTMMQVTINRIDRLRDALRDYMYAMQINDPIPKNHYATLIPSLTTGTIYKNGCRPGYGWHDLLGTASAVISAAGLVPEEFGKTAWGAPIQLCVHYDPMQRNLDAPPYYGALRIHKSLSLGMSSTDNDSDNVVFSF